MQVTVTKKTTYADMAEACAATMNRDSANPAPLTLYVSNHSPIRTQEFKVFMEDIPTFVSVHLVRHGMGQLPFVGTNREDRPGYTGDLGRMQPVNHLAHVNAQTLITMARWRFCFKAHAETREVMRLICDGVRACDPALARVMMPNCFWHGGICYEPRICGRVKGVRHWKAVGLPVWDAENPEYRPQHVEQMAKEGGAA